ncbi:hypothetical protein HHI36_002921, partial [Cryptolaemus montrouzieri]
KRTARCASHKETFVVNDTCVPTNDENLAPPVLRLLGSFSTNRTQRVIEYDENEQRVLFHSVHVGRGVPQDSILAPMLYIIYTNDLIDSVEDEMVQFADYTSL